MFMQTGILLQMCADVSLNPNISNHCISLRELLLCIYRGHLGLLTDTKCEGVELWEL